MRKTIFRFKSCKTTVTLNLTQLPISEKSQPTKRVSNKTLGLVLRLLYMVVSRANYFGKWVGAQNQKHSNRDIKFQNNEVTGQGSKQLKLKKIREINQIINLQINLSWCRTSDHYFLLSLQQLLWGLLSSTHRKMFWKLNKSWCQKRCGKNQILHILLK